MNLAETFYSLPSSDEKDEYFQQILAQGNYANFEKQVKVHLNKPKKKEHYYYMLTYTLDPRLAERVGGFTNSYYDRVERYITKQAQNKSWGLTFFAYVREGGDNEHKHTHWHVSIRTNKYFDFVKNTSYYAKLYGSVDKQDSILSTNIYAKKYMSKQSPPIILIGEFDKDLTPNSQTLKYETIEWRKINSKKTDT